MDTYRRLEELPTIEGTALTIGTFDGLHRGHLAVIRQVVARAREQSATAAVITFDPHPQHVLASPDIPRKKLIVTLDQKLDLLARQGIDLTLVLTFDVSLSRITAHDFLRGIIVRYFSPVAVIVGYDHHFGYRREGNANFLRRHAEQFGYEVDLVDEVNLPAHSVSSTRIRQLLREGHCEEVELLLGRPYEIPGVVRRGTGRGKELDFPTANLEPLEPRQLIPGRGVYIVSADIGDQASFGMCNVGVRPTFDEQDLMIETHFFESPAEELYGERLGLRFHHRIRDERRFSGPVELRSQLERDREASLEWIARYHGGNRVYATIQ